MGQGNDLGTELRRLWLLVHNTSIWIRGMVVPTSCHRRNNGRGMGVAPSVVCSAPGQCWLGLVQIFLKAPR